VTARIPPVLRPEHPSARSLAGLIEEFGLEHRGVVDGVEITGVTLSTADVRPGDLYVGLQGANSHGASFVGQAKDGGAVALFTDLAGAELAADAGLPILIVDSPRGALGDISAWVYRTNESPPLLFATTGTNGKTSTTYLLEGILKQLGLVTGLSSTAERHIGDEVVVSRLTTPEASEMHALLARMRESKVRAVAIEVSAQALTRHRVDGLLFDVVAFTNLSHDHLDDYRDMEEYFEAKLELFQPDRGKRGVVSLDSDWGSRVVELSRIPVTTISSTPGIDAEWTVTVLDEQVGYTEFRLDGPEGRSLTTRVPIIGWHMAANGALAIVMLVEAGFELGAIAHALERPIDSDDGPGEEPGGIVAYLPGRTERVSADHGPTVYVDFGHSADAFEQTLLAVRKVTTGKVIMVFGADGDRDASKRHEMARVAAQGSDILVITDHHPRFENPASIRATLLEGAELADSPAEVHEVSPPERAIRVAVGLAKEGDSILWAGPGHQDYRDIEGVRTPYSAREEARAALREAGWM
jgi:UDP-N-acetylmuramoyl-L-alanyl-D-glutamate--2,6-diaminopimelate ligase